MYLLRNTVTGEFAHFASSGQHDGLTTDNVSDAREFDSYGEAAEFNQNFGPEWTVCDPFAAWGRDAFDVSMGRAIRRELPAW
jgi:hypothetical protein